MHLQANHSRRPLHRYINNYPQFSSLSLSPALSPKSNFFGMAFPRVSDAKFRLDADVWTAIYDPTYDSVHSQYFAPATTTAAAPSETPLTMSTVISCFVLGGAPPGTKP